ncbi:OB-fold domain-containing protein [Streptomyces sp. SID4956]|uniref:OB-fold domain-containing protein n=1 Tax=Streptomyces sp. SID4956 TaxID=2690290 RepID=UPI00136E9428|nr:hypothetical protein [Streptomyces sp. SID4956]
MTSVPVVLRDTETAAFFDGTARGELLIRHCAACGQYGAPQERSCPSCGSPELTWAPARGTGTLVSWTTVHGRPPKDGGPAPRTTVGLVELDEGPWLHARVVDAEQTPLTTGAAVSVAFEGPTAEAPEAETVPVFRPAQRR